MRQLTSMLLTVVALSAQALTFTSHFPTTNSASFVAVTSNPRIVYVLWDRALFRSEDGGATFAQRRSTDYIDNLIVDSVSPDILYHWNREEIRRSMDGGVSWQSTDWPRPQWPAQLLVDPLHPSTLLLLSRCYGASESALYRSDDRGDHWQMVRSGGPCIEEIAIDPISDELYTTMLAAKPKEGRIVPAHVVVADPATPRVRFGIGYDVRVRQRPLPVVVITSDGGKNWQRMQTPGVTGDVRSIALDPISRRLFLATSAGIYVRAETGGEWTRLAAAPEANARTVTLNATTLFVLTDRTVYRAPLPMLDPFTPGGIVAPLAVVGFAVDPNAHLLYAAGSNIWRSRDSGESWESITSESLNYQTITVDAAGDLYTIVGHWYGTPSEGMRFIPATGEWRKAGQIPYGGYFPSLAAHPTRPGVLFASADVHGDVTAGLYMTTDAGDHWTPIPLIDSPGLSIAISPKAPDVVHASSYKGTYVSRDAGVTWTKTSAMFPGQIVVAPSDPFRVYAAYTGTFLRSDDGGATWTWISSIDIGLMAVDPLDEESIWVAGFSLRHSTDGGRAWQPEPWNVPGPLYAWRAIIDPDGSRLHIALSSDEAYPPYIGTCEWDAVLRPAGAR